MFSRRHLTSSRGPVSLAALFVLGASAAGCLSAFPDETQESTGGASGQAGNNEGGSSSNTGGGGATAGNAGNSAGGVAGKGAGGASGSTSLGGGGAGAQGGAGHAGSGVGGGGHAGSTGGSSGAGTGGLAGKSGGSGTAGAAGSSGAAGVGGGGAAGANAGAAGVAGSAAGVGGSAGAGAGGVAGAGGSAGSGAVCTEATTQCQGTILQTCTMGQWLNTTPCPYVCTAGACAGECTPGDIQCDAAGKAVQSCDTTAMWHTLLTCPAICSMGSCTGSCSPTTTQCSGTTLQTCNASGSYDNTMTCPFVCTAGACAGSCTPGDIQCNGTNVVQTCDHSGTWQTSATCPFLCAAGACTGSCAPGATQCDASGTKIQTCDTTASWQDSMACPAICSSGMCTGSCSPGTTQCSGTTLQLCSNQGAYQASKTCPFVCASGACSGSCVPGATTCNNGTAQTCDSTGTFQDTKTCPFVCSGGACSGQCVPNSVQCDAAGKNVQTCDSTGTWQNSTSCPSICSAGACTGSCVPGALQCSSNALQKCSSAGEFQTTQTCPYLCTGMACTGSCVPGSTSCSNNELETCDATGTPQPTQSCPFVCAAGACTGVCLPNSTQCDTKNQVFETCSMLGAWVDSAMPCASPPQLIAPLSTATTTSQTPTLHWKLPAGTDGAFIEICSDHACSKLVTSFTASGSNGKPSAALAAGTYFWRATGMNNSVKGSTTSPVWEMIVGHKSAPIDTSWGAVPDLNGDGSPEFLISDGHASSVYIFQGNGVGIGASSGAISGTYIIPVGDTNGDGYGDVGITGGASTTSIYLGSATGINTSAGIPLNGTNIPMFPMGDINNDGYADVMLGNAPTNVVNIYFGGPSGPSVNPTALPTPPGASNWGVDIAVGDFNGDTFVDVVIPAWNSDKAFVFMGNGLSFGAPSTIAGPGGTNLWGRSVVASDVNGDGYADLIIGTQDSETCYAYMGGPGGLGAAAAWMYTSTPSGAGFGRSMGAGDFNGDGYGDVVISANRMGSSAGEMYVFLGGSGGLAATPVFNFLAPMNALAGQAVNGAGDINGDGYGDIIFGAYGINTAYVFLGASGGISATAPLTITGVDPGGGFAVNVF